MYILYIYICVYIYIYIYTLIINCEDTSFIPLFADILLSPANLSPLNNGAWELSGPWELSMNNVNMMRRIIMILILYIYTHNAHIWIMNMT